MRGKKTEKRHTVPAKHYLDMKKQWETIEDYEGNTGSTYLDTIRKLG